MIEFNYNNKNADRTVTPEDMMRVKKLLTTPKRLGGVIKADGMMCDSPTVFRHNGRFYMYYIMISKNVNESGYETHIAVSDDLVKWEYMGKILKRDENRDWDSGQIAGYAALCDIDLFGSHEIGQYDGKYYISYLAGNSNGYEPDPLLMGIASTDDPVNGSFTRRDKPILTPFDDDTRFFEDKTLYKSFIFEDKDVLTGHRFVNCYNTKYKANGTERIYLAVSDDMENWERYGRYPVIDDVTGDPRGRISGDPQIIRLDDGLYVMAYFRFVDGMGAFDTFAASYDLIHWTKWVGEPLIEKNPDDPNEDIYAHKPWIVGWNGKVYHFYCSVGTSGERYISLAVSE